jgi:hypothetical protein
MGYKQALQVTKLLSGERYCEQYARLQELREKIIAETIADWRRKYLATVGRMLAIPITWESLQARGPEAARILPQLEQILTAIEGYTRGERMALEGIIARETAGIDKDVRELDCERAEAIRAQVAEGRHSVALSLLERDRLFHALSGCRLRLADLYPRDEDVFLARGEPIEDRQVFEGGHPLQALRRLIYLRQWSAHPWSIFSAGSTPMDSSFEIVLPPLRQDGAEVRFQLDVSPAESTALFARVDRELARQFNPASLRHTPFSRRLATWVTNMLRALLLTSPYTTVQRVRVPGWMELLAVWTEQHGKPALLPLVDPRLCVYVLHPRRT